MKITCPESTCHAENDASREICTRCQTPLRSYAKLLTYQAHLFNRGLEKARAHEFQQARDLFAAVIWWCPTDWEARNAFAAACFSLDDLDQAQLQWEHVAEHSPMNSNSYNLARMYLDQLARENRSAPSKESQQDVQNLAVVQLSEKSKSKAQSKSQQRLKQPKKFNQQNGNQKHKKKH